VLGAIAANAQLMTLTKDQMIKLTAKNPYERFEDGRPKVPDALIERMKGMSAEDVWTILPGKGFPNHFAGDFKLTKPGTKLVGRVVTAQFMPVRGDLNEIIAAEGKQKGYFGGQNQWVLDQLQPGDVVVIDLFGKNEYGTFVGDNLAYYIMQKTKTGLVVDGAVRDLEGIATFDLPVYYRNAHPTPIRDVMLTGFNVPIRIGGVTVLPGDIVLGDREGISIVPPQLVEDVVKRGEDTKIHDDWTKMKFKEGKYKSSDIYGSPRDPALKQEYEEYRKKAASQK
ncbi:MAG TPA: dimethylmenaquinone methyltransferase, partial [Bryobacteraceae bacterium]|nr:dimethylmenaquinone methyltransferase [Bryobacteraceae bacterium]